jgi:molybdopterin-guanine dinucleotide biosynthesis protein A
MKLFGLVLSGGLSTRMGSDKGSLIYGPSSCVNPTHKLTQRIRSFRLLSRFCEEVFISCRKEQHRSIEVSLPVIFDSVDGEGPGVGVLSAFQRFPNNTWLIFACDFPFANEADVAHLVQSRSQQHAATCYIHSDSAGVIEPLFSIWEREALEALKNRFQEFGQSPSRVLRSLQCKEVVPLHRKSLLNVNRPGDWPSDRVC